MNFLDNANYRAQVKDSTGRRAAAPCADREAGMQATPPGTALRGKTDRLNTNRDFLATKYKNSKGKMVKNEDPKKRAGDLKDPLHLLPTVALRQTARALKCGADKYGVYNWRESDGVKASTYAAAMMRHLLQFMDGEDTDAESGLSHLAHIMATCCILLDAGLCGKLIDDRTKKPVPAEFSLPRITLKTRRVKTDGRD